MLREEVLALLDAENFEGFIGATEDAGLEFKGAPYVLDDRAATFELAKDVSAFANGEGGLLLVGFRTRKLEVSRQDVVQAARPFQRQRLDLDRARSIIGTKVFPEIESLTLSWKGDNDRGIAIIDVPAQPVEKKPFIILEPIEESGQTPGFLVGFVARRGADAEPMRAQDLHRLLRDGQGLARQLDRLEASLARIESRAPEAGGQAVTIAALRQRIDEAIEG